MSYEIRYQDYDTTVIVESDEIPDNDTVFETFKEAKEAAINALEFQRGQITAHIKSIRKAKNIDELNTKN